MFDFSLPHSKTKMIFLVIFLFNIVFIANIHSKPVDSSDTQTVNHVPWDAYEYAKNISKQLSKELELNMNNYSGGFKDFESEVGSQTVRFYNGAAEYNDDSVDLANLIANGTFNVKTDKNKTIIEFGPNFKEFTVLYRFVDKNRPNLSQFFGIIYKEFPILVKIERDHDNGNIEAKIEYKGTGDASTRVTFDKEYDAYVDAISNNIAYIDGMNIPILKKNLISNSFRDWFKVKFCNLFESDSKFLQPQLKNIVKTVPFPNQNLTTSRWEEISQKMNEEGLKNVFKKEYEYAVEFTNNLQGVIKAMREIRSWPSVESPLPPKLRSDSSEDNNMFKLKYAYVEGYAFDFSYYYLKSKIKKGSFSIRTTNNTKTIRFAPNFPYYRIAYEVNIPGLKAVLDVPFKSLPMEIEVVQQTDIDETQAKIHYQNVSRSDEIVEVSSPFEENEKLPPSLATKENYEKFNSVLIQFNDSAEFRNSLRGIFEPGSTYLHEFMDPIVSFIDSKNLESIDFKKLLLL